MPWNLRRSWSANLSWERNCEKLPWKVARASALSAGSRGDALAKDWKAWLRRTGLPWPAPYICARACSCACCCAFVCACWFTALRPRSPGPCPATLGATAVGLFGTATFGPAAFGIVLFGPVTVRLALLEFDRSGVATFELAAFGPVGPPRCARSRAPVLLSLWRASIRCCRGLSVTALGCAPLERVVWACVICGVATC